MITEDYCSDEVSKLLRKRGFNEGCGAYYEDGKFCWVWYNGFSRNTDNPKYVSCPTHQMAMKWLRKKHNIIIVIEPHFYNPMEEKVSSYVFSIWCGDNYENPLTNNYPTFEETVEAALKYVLENLI